MKVRPLRMICRRHGVIVPHRHQTWRFIKRYQRWEARKRNTCPKCAVIRARRWQKRNRRKVRSYLARPETRELQRARWRRYEKRHKKRRAIARRARDAAKWKANPELLRKSLAKLYASKARAKEKRKAA